MREGGREGWRERIREQEGGWEGGRERVTTCHLRVDLI